MMTANTPIKHEAIKKADTQLTNAGMATYTEMAWLLNEAIHHIRETDANRLLRERIQGELKAIQGH